MPRHNRFLRSCRTEWMEFLPEMKCRTKLWPRSVVSQSAERDHRRRHHKKVAGLRFRHRQLGCEPQTFRYFFGATQRHLVLRKLRQIKTGVKANGVLFGCNPVE